MTVKTKTRSLAATISRIEAAASKMKITGRKIKGRTKVVTATDKDTTLSLLRQVGGILEGTTNDSLAEFTKPLADMLAEIESIDNDNQATEQATSKANAELALWRSNLEIECNTREDLGDVDKYREEQSKNFDLMHTAQVIKYRDQLRKERAKIKTRETTSARFRAEQELKQLSSKQILTKIGIALNIV